MPLALALALAPNPCPVALALTWCAASSARGAKDALLLRGAAAVPALTWGGVGFRIRARARARASAQD